MSRLLVFNPEHDYALASNNQYYYPPAGIISLKNKLQYLPLLSADNDDFLLDSSNRLVKTVDLQGTDIASEVGKITKIVPWGWDSAIKTKLIGMGFNSKLFPSDLYLKNLRRLSHRRISISCNDFLNSPYIPTEFFDLEAALEFYSENQDCCFKAPWSSSGRGVMFCKGLAFHAVKEWTHGVIKKQKSVLAESFAEKKLDFASLWEIENENINFRGFSISFTDNRGRYLGNLYGPQIDIKKYISNYTNDMDDHILQLQQKFIERYIAPFYSGRLGIDMIADSEGNIRPCIEINLRNTMGHIAIDIQNRISFNPTYDFERKLKYFSNIFILINQV